MDDDDDDGPKLKLSAGLAIAIVVASKKKHLMSIDGGTENSPSQNRNILLEGGIFFPRRTEDLHQRMYGEKCSDYGTL